MNIAEIQRIAEEVIAESPLPRRVADLRRKIERTKEQCDRMQEFYAGIRWLQEDDEDDEPQAKARVPAAAVARQPVPVPAVQKNSMPPKAVSSITPTRVGTIPTSRVTAKPIHDSNVVNSARELRARHEAIRKGKGWPSLDREEELMATARQLHGTAKSAEFADATKKELAKYRDLSPLLKSVFFDGVSLPSKPIAVKKFSTPTRVEREAREDAVRIGLGGVSIQQEKGILRGVQDAIRKGTYTAYCQKIAKRFADCDRRSLSPAMQSILSTGLVGTHWDGKGGSQVGPAGYPQITQ